MKFVILSAILATPSLAFTPWSKVSTKVKTTPKSSVLTDQDRPRFDPFGLYPKNAPERKKGLIQPLEKQVSTPQGPVKDPLKLYKTSNEDIDTSAAMSASLPFLKRPEMLDGSLPGDRGFDPFNLAYDEKMLNFQRTAEVKHARLAMLAAVGWPIAELLDRTLASQWGLKPLLVDGRVPSVLNGGLASTPFAFWAATLGVAAAIETYGLLKEQSATEAGAMLTPGDLGFDPFGLTAKTPEGRKYELEAELFNGRLAMLAITGFALQEWWTKVSVVNETPEFFKPLSESLSILAGSTHF